MNVLVTNGCSFTSGSELKEPEKTVWGKLLADKMELDFVNLGKEGSGNDRIVRTTIEWISKNRELKPFFIIAWSDIERVEYFSNIYQKYYGLSFAKKISMIFPMLKTISKMHWNYINDHNHRAEETLRNIISLQSIFKSFEIPYLMFHTFEHNYWTEHHSQIFEEPVDIPNSWAEQFKDNKENFMKCIDIDHFPTFHKNFAMRKYLKETGLPHGEHWHPLEEAQIEWSNFLWESFMKNIK